MTETVYIETSILGCLTARSTNNLILAANIKITQDWWDEYSNSLALYTSELVEDEAARGDPTIASQRLNLCFTHGAGNSLWLKLLANLELQAHGKFPNPTKIIRD